MATKSNKNAKIAAGVGAGLAIAAAAVAGAYFLYGKDGAKNRKKIKGWMLKAKGEVLEKMEKMKDVNEEAYHALVDSVLAKYKEMEVGDLANEMKNHWKSIKRHISDDNGTAKKKSASKKKTAKKKSASKKKTS